MNTLLGLTFYSGVALLFIGISFHLMHKVADLQSEVYVNRRLLQRCQNNIIDMGFQLFNLTQVVNNGHPGYVYVVKSDTGHYKIGRTVNFRDRAKTFGVKLPVEIEFLVLIETGNDMLLEATLHQQYQHKRVNGEWFSLDDNDMLFLTAYPGNILTTDAA
jgi:hypothetical protein